VGRMLEVIDAKRVRQKTRRLVLLPLSHETRPTAPRGSIMSCKVCDHAHKDEISQAIRNGLSTREIASLWTGLSKSAVHRHAMHIPKIEGAPPLLESQRVIRQRRGVLERLLLAAEAENDYKTCVGIIKQLSELDARVFDPIDRAANKELRVRILYGDPRDETGEKCIEQGLPYLNASVQVAGWKPALKCILEAAADSFLTVLLNERDRRESEKTSARIQADRDDPRK
jgi:hypothetical protein